MIDIFERLDGLQPTADSLNAESDSVNTIIDKFEERASKLNLGVEASVDLYERETTAVDPNDRDETKVPVTRVTFLSYERYQGAAWRLTIQERVYYLDEFDNAGDLLNEDPAILLRQAPRQTRIDALEELPKLIDAMHEAAKEMLAKVNEAKKTLK